MKLGLWSLAVGLLIMISPGAAQVASNTTPAMILPSIGKLPYSMQMHGTAIVGNRLYIFGGDLAGGASETEWTNRVQSAPIDLTSRTFGAWREEEPMPELRAYLNNCVEVVNDRIYIVGGSSYKDATDEDSFSRVNTVLWTQVGADGRLKPWTTSTSFPGNGVVLSASCSTEEQLLLTGGMNKGGHPEIYAANLDATGNVQSWRIAGKFPMPLFNHGACVQGGRLYAWGGNTATGVPNRRVLSAPFSKAGEVGDWREEAQMPEGIYGAACCGINDYLVTIGGRRKNGITSNDIWFARMEAGYINKWQEVTTNLQSTVYHSVGLQKDNGWVLITGGTSKKTANATAGQILNTVQAFQVPQQAKDRLKVLSAGAGGDKIASSFISMELALAKAAASNKTVLAFFYSPEVPACKRFWDEVATQPAFQALTDKYILAAIDTSQKNFSWGPKFGVFKVPTLVEVSASGEALKSARGLETIEEVRTFLSRSNDR